MSEELFIDYIDVYSPSGKCNQSIRHLAELSKVDTIYHWVHIRDADSAHRVLSNNGIKGRFQLCGRRAWTQQMVVDEIRRLWTRFENSINHIIRLILCEVPSPAAVQYSGERRRPDLAPPQCVS